MTRAFVASCGAGLCLVAASVTALFILSAIVAVRGWPGIGPENDVQRVQLAESAFPSGEDGAEPAVLTAPIAAAPIVLGGPSGAARPGTTRDADRTGSRDGSPSSPAGGVTAPSPVGGPAITTPPSAPAQPGTGTPGRPAVVDSATSTAGGAVRSTGESAGGTAESVAPGSGGPVTQVTDQVADTVEGTGNAVDRTVQDTGRAVESVTRGDVGGAVRNVGGAVENVGGAVHGLLDGH